MNLLLLLTLACRSDDEPETEDCWYCEDSSSPATDSEEEKDTGKKGGKDDTGKGGKDDTGKGGKDDTGGAEGDTWSAEVALDWSAGSVQYTRVTETGSCILGGSFTALVPVEDCGDCQFAAELSYGALTVSKDDGGCEDIADLLALEGTTAAFGSGSKSLGSYDGVEYFDLKQRLEGAWKSVEGGYSGLGESWLLGGK